MPARIVVVTEEPFLGGEIVNYLTRLGYEALAIPDSLVALDTLEGATLIELLITSIDFPGPKPNGVSLALMARNRRPGMKVIFIGSPDYALYAAGLGEIISTPASASGIAQRAMALLGSPTPGDLGQVS